MPNREMSPEKEAEGISRLWRTTSPCLAASSDHDDPPFRYLVRQTQALALTLEIQPIYRCMNKERFPNCYTACMTQPKNFTIPACKNQTFFIK